MRAVTEFTGSTPSNPGILASRLHTKASAAPMSIAPGIKIRWLELWNMARQR